MCGLYCTCTILTLTLKPDLDLSPGPEQSDLAKVGMWIRVLIVHVKGS